jgi:signal transduction histidine kinase/CheY-like chemotaxis protein
MPSGAERRMAREAPNPLPDQPIRPGAARAEVEPRAARRLRLRAYQLEALARQAGRVPIPVLLAAGFVAATVSGFVPWPQIGAWITAVCVVLAARWSYSYVARRDPATNVTRALRVMTTLSAVNGFVTGVGPLVFMSMLPYERQTILTMIVVGWSAGAVAANAAYSKAFLAYSIPLLGLLSLYWVTSPVAGGSWIALLVALFLVIQAGFVRDNERVFRRSFAIRYRNEHLLRKLRQERQAVIHERDRAEEANRAKSRFLAHASHDLRQPLAAIAINGDVLAKRARDPETGEIGREIVHSIESLARLLDRLLHLSNLEAGGIRPEPIQFALDRLLRRLAKGFARMAEDKGLRFRLQLNGRMLLNTDALLLEDAVSNLIHNAIKYTERGEVVVHARSENGKAVIEITDTGPGIPESERERIFEPLYQLANPARDRSRGVGLGLANVRHVVRLLDIELSLDSEVGRGSTFRLALPLVMLEVRSAAETQLIDEIVQLPASLRTLVVDDEEPIRKGLQRLVEDWSANVAVAADYDEAMRCIKAATFDLIITDYRLPGGRTGVELVTAAREAQPRLAAVLVSGDTAEERKREALEAGLMLVEKPVSAERLQKHISRALRQMLELHSVRP